MNAVLNKPSATIFHPSVADLDSAVYTIGYEGRTQAEYITLLVSAGVQLVVDVRMNPISRKKGFSKTILSESLANIGIAYLHIKELGIESALRKNLESEESYENLFEFYSTALLPSAISGLGMLVEVLEAYRTVALTCFEKEALHCHRHCVSDYLYSMGVLKHEPIHL